MARMPSKRWVEMVDSHCRCLAKQGRCLDGPAMLRSEAATLLSRQHASFVRLVKKLPRTLCTTTRGQMFEAVSLNELLAALAKMKGGG